MNQTRRGRGRSWIGVCCTALAAALPLIAQPLSAQNVRLRSVGDEKPEVVRTEIEAPPEPAPELRMHDVTDLVTAPKEGGASGRREVAIDVLADYVRAFAVPRPESRDTVMPFRGHALVALTKPATHEWIERFLAKLREVRSLATEQQYVVTSRFYSLTDEVFAERIALLLGGSPHGRPIEESYTVLTTPSKDFLRELHEVEGVEVLMAPRVLSLPVMRCELSAGSEIAFIKDYDVRKVGESILADPVVDTLFDGLRSSLVVSDLPDGRLGLSVRAEIFKLEGEVPKYEVDLQRKFGKEFPELPPTKVWIQLPSGQTSTVEFDVRVPDGSTVLVALPNKIDGRWQVMTVDVERLGDALPEAVPIKGAGRR